MVQAAPAWRSAGRTFFDQPRQVLTVAGNGLASYRLSDAVLRGREIADVSAAEERNRVALGASRSLAGKSVWWANVLKVERQPAMHPIAVRA